MIAQLKIIYTINVCVKSKQWNAVSLENYQAKSEWKKKQKKNNNKNYFIKNIIDTAMSAITLLFCTSWSIIWANPMNNLEPKSMLSEGRDWEATV